MSSAFSASKCAEKYLKAYLEEKGTAFKKTHDLVVLLNAAGKGLTTLVSRRKALARLSTFGIAARYPGVDADAKAMHEALKTADAVRAALRQKLLPS